ncbi:hypothetical protein F66182_8985 [Fusarium sp. NRRL 66182]|nr:hypothetical protein F66182_8985 [Fusarium sp. NRRL 66182]
MPRNKREVTTPRGARNARGGRGGVRGGRAAAFHGRGNHSTIPQRVNFIRDETVGFTLADEARQTSQHDHSVWGSSSLRSRPVTFISAGHSEPLKLLDEIIDETNQELYAATEETEEDENEENGDIQTDDQRDNVLPKEDEFIGPDDLEQAIQAETVLEEDVPYEPSFYFDLKGDQSQKTSDRAPVEIPERPSSRSSSSSEEVILFKGRGAQRPTQPAPYINMAQMQTEIRVVEKAIMSETGPPSASPAPEQPMEPARSRELSKKQKKQKQQRANKRVRQTRFENEYDDEEDTILADYIANIKENSDVEDYFRQLIEGGEMSESSSIDIKEDYFPSQSVVANGDGSDRDTEENPEEATEDEIPSEIDDETLARLIAGHDLGMEDVYFGESLSDSDSSNDEPTQKKKQQQAFEDDFDLMEWDRPSLRRHKGKGARAQINFNVSNSELEATLQASWKNDRLKKSERKKQREEMRALGMLGKKANTDDLRVKYPNGMNMEQVAEEIRTFLMGTDDQLTLPPMDNHARKMIHELANKFKVKSKSTGKGDQRRPTLHRNGRTLPYVAATFDQAFSRINRRYFPRLDQKGKKGKRQPPVRGGTSLAAATIQDGEVVGASAPELGIENRGRAMLEKMGWSTGTALGASNNKGIMLPVTQTMKRSKAGLG